MRLLASAAARLPGGAAVRRRGRAAIQLRGRVAMRLLVTGAAGLLGSNLAAAAAQQSWSVCATWRGTPVSVPGARAMRLDVSDRRACVRLAEEFEPDVIVHAAAEPSPARVAGDPGLAELRGLDVEHTLAAARTVRARYALVSCEHVFSGERPTAERWEERDRTEPGSELGRAQLACERLVQGSACPWLIARPADVYGVNLAICAATPVRRMWESSGPALRWVAQLRGGQPLAPPDSTLRTPTYAWDWAHIVCELLAQECEGVFHTAGPTVLGRLAYMRALARAFECDMRLVQEPPQNGAPAPANFALSDGKLRFALGRPAVDPFTGQRLMRRQLERVLGRLGLVAGSSWETSSAPARAPGGLG